MKISTIKKHILTTLEPFAKENGYKVVRSKFILTTTKDNFIKQFAFEYNVQGDEIHIFPYVQLKSLVIHDICEINNFHLNYTAFINLFLLERIDKGTFTEDTRWKLQLQQKDRFVIRNEADLDTVEFKIQDMMSLGLNYLNTNSNMDSINRMYNDNPFDKYNPNCSGMDTHCIIGIISSKLSKNENYDGIKKAYQHIIMTQDFLPETKESFWAILKYLDRKL